MSPRDLRWALVALAALAAGCNNPCQSLCSDMAALSDELGCGVSYTDAEVETCEEAFASATADERQTCAEFGGLEVMRQNWTCDDINLYRDAGGN